jgi:hypothetical protein
VKAAGRSAEIFFLKKGLCRRIWRVSAAGTPTRKAIALQPEGLYFSCCT